MLTENVFNHQGVTGIRVGGSLIGKPLMTMIFYYLDKHLIDTASYRTRRLVDRFCDEHIVKKILLTHYHEDHSGNAGFLQKKLNIPVMGHANTADHLSRPIALKPYEHFIFGKVETARITPAPKHILLDQYQLTPIFTPGHSNDHTVYIEENRGWLFSGDLFLGPKIKYWRQDEKINDTIQSIKTVLGYEFDTIFCGHNPQFSSGKKLLKSKLDQLQSLVDEVLDLKHKGLKDKEICRTMTQGRESHLTKLITIGDVSYRNMIVAAITAANEQLSLQ